MTPNGPGQSALRICQHDHDNLIAAGKAKPMIVVMPIQGIATATPPAPESTMLQQEYLKDIIPYVESHYRVQKNREYRAIAGLSMVDSCDAYRIAASGYLQ